MIIEFLKLYLSDEDQAKALQDILSIIANNDSCQGNDDIICYLSSSEHNNFDKICKLLHYSQDKLFRRKKKDGCTKERNEVTSEAWMNNADLMSQLEKLKIVNEIKYDIDSCKSKDRISICVLGACLPAIKTRFQYAKKIFDQYNKEIKTISIYLLTGTRKVNKDSDKYDENELEKIMKYNKIDEFTQLNEIHLMKYMFDETFGKNFHCIVINVETDSDKRATTANTVSFFIKTTDIYTENLCFVSNAPYIMYQHNVIAACLYKIKNEIEYQVVGSQMKLKEKSCDDVSIIIEALGNFIFSKTPFALMKIDGEKDYVYDDKKMNSLISSYDDVPEFKQLIEDIYKKKNTTLKDVHTTDLTNETCAQIT